MVYIRLLRQNRSYRCLWLGEVISYLGDWFNTIALYTIVQELSGRSQAVAWVVIAQTLPIFLMVPLGGSLADRFDRRRLMLMADFLRALACLGLIAAEQLGSLNLLFASLVFMVTCSGIFIPAQRATLPQITTREELVDANSLSGGSWSVMLAFGALAGGLVTAAIGETMSIAVDGLTFLMSAWFISYLPPIPPGNRLSAIRRLRSVREDLGESSMDMDTSAPGPDPSGTMNSESSGSPEDLARDVGFLAGLHYLSGRPYLLFVTCLKGSMAFSSAVQVLIPIYGNQLFPTTSGPRYIGLIFSVRGIGALIGSMGATRLFASTTRNMQRMLVPAMLFNGMSYLVLSWAPHIGWACLGYLGGGIGGGLAWVYSSSLAQIGSPNEFRGRIFSLEFGLMTLGVSVMSWLAGYLMDNAGWSPRDVAQVSGLLMVIPATAWTVVMWVKRRECEGIPSDLELRDIQSMVPELRDRMHKWGDEPLQK